MAEEKEVKIEDRQHPMDKPFIKEESIQLDVVGRPKSKTTGAC